METITNLQLKLRKTEIVRRGQGKLEVLLEGDDLLEAIDATLHLHAWTLSIESYEDQGARTWWIGQIAKLIDILEAGGSAWQVSIGRPDRLTERVDQTVVEAVNTTIGDARSDASEHLRWAWNAAYGVQPDPTRAYSEAVKAVEAITIPEVLPKDRDATLGRVLGQLKATADKWTVSIDDRDGQAASSAAVIAMIDLLWWGQRDRHAGPEMKAASLEAARMAVHTAATVVQWFTSGHIHKKT
ncbi:hypothetical protein [Actinomadura sp. 6N118]|uniref:hypothetical protein n=1 Tax=Actinomadura sp. 6N118 TaxID=3375151 RepID=UPI00378998C2